MNDVSNNTPIFESDSSLSLTYIWAILLKRLWLIGICFLSVMLLVVGYLATVTPLFESTAVLQVELQEQRLYNSDASKTDDVSNANSSDEVLKTIEQDLQLDSLFESVITDPDISEDRDFLPGLKASNQYLPIKILSTDKEWSKYDIIRALKQQTTIALRHGTRLIDISVDHPIPAVAQKLTQAVVNHFVADYGQMQTGKQKQGMQFLLGEADRLKQNLQKSEDALQIYKSALLVKDRVTDQQKILDDLSQRYRDMHPKMIQAKALMSDIRQSFDEEIKKVMVNSPSEASYWAANATQISTDNQDNRIDAELKFVEARTNVLQRENDTESALFDNVLKQMREADVSKEGAPTIVRIAAPAAMPDPTKPAKPKKTIILFFGALGGMLLGIALVLLLDRLDTSLKSVEEAEQSLRLPVLAVLPLVKFKNSSKKSAPANLSGSSDINLPLVPIISDPSSHAAENIRSMRASLNLLGKETERRTTLFTSALASEGKSFASSNYAASLAQQGLRTLLIDADLRRPTVHTYFNLKNDGLGLTEHVAKGLDLSKAVHANIIENLDLLLTGVKNPNPAEFLSGSGFSDTMKEALLQYDRIVVDSPPVILVGDTQLLVAHVQSICLVVRAEQTSRRAVLRAIDLLEMANVKPIGIILNCYRSHGVAGYYTQANYYYSSHKYGNAYGSY